MYDPAIVRLLRKKHVDLKASSPSHLIAINFPRYWKDALPQSKDDLSEAIGSTKGVCHTKTPKMCLHIVDVEAF